MINTNLKLRFKPVSHSWVALHPQPKGVIQFIAGAFFGKGRCHDFALFKASRIHFHPETQGLYDSGYQGIDQ